VEVTPPEQDDRAPRSLPGAGNMVTGGGYAMLFLLGLMQGVIGSFQYGGVLGPDTSAGTWFLFGGSGCAVAGAVLAYARWSRPRQRTRT
jgi:hypothetical protein